MLSLEAVQFSYGRQPVLSGIDLSLERGEIACVLGPNGSGKTTLLRLAAGLLAPGRGTVRFQNADPATATRRRLARRLAYVPQDYRLVFPYRVSEVVLMGRYAHGPPGPLGLEQDEDVEAARAAMERCDVLALADRRFDQISGGEKRRALLAQAFCQRADLVLLDEPTAGLDPAHAIALFEALRAERDRRETAALVVTHDLNFAARFADRALLLDRGGVAADGPPGEVLGSEATARAFDVAMHVGRLPGTDTPFVVPR